MTNRSIAILANIQNKSYEEKEKAVKEVVSIEYKKIIVQAKRYNKICNWDNYVKNIISTKNSDELFFYLDHLTVIEISLISSFGIDVAFMNLLKVSE